MPEQTSNENGYATAAELYWQAGWRGVLPIRRGCKKNPPTGYTGKVGVEPSYPDVLAWADLYPDGNLCLRLPDGVTGIDVDAYGAKTGARALKEAEHRWGPLPATVKSTSRTDGISGIRLYRIPSGTELAESVEFPDLGVGDIEIVQRKHRYVLAWPSIHPEGRGYWWLNDDNQHVGIPNIDQLPDLPTAWVQNLPAAKTTVLDGNTFHTPTALTTGEPSTQVTARLRQAIKELNLPGHSRHVTCRGHVLALLRLGKTGQPGVQPALLLLGEMFVALVTPDRAGGKQEAHREYRAMVLGPGAARELAQPSVNDWTHHIDTAAAARSQPEPEHPVPPPRPTLEDIENGFWEARESLQMVYTTALSKMCSPWEVLAHTAARALTLVRPCVVLPALIGGPGSLNTFCAVTAASGGGKGAASAAARILVPARIEQRNLGSGEGLVQAFGRADDSETAEPLHEALMFTADEIDTITALGQRTGSTTMSILRAGFSGETLGFSYAAREKRRHIEAHSYRMTLVISVQPERASGLLADAGGGTPQRFMWFPGTDNRITADCPWETGPLQLPNNTKWQYPRTLTIPDEATDLIRGERVKAMHGDTDALDGHALFCREKFAYALTVLDGRAVMTLDDWELSGIAAEVSRFTREQVAGTLAEASGREAEARGLVRGIEMDAADTERDHRKIERTQRVLRWLLEKLDSAGSEGMTQQEITRKIASRDRSTMQTALVIAVDDGLIARAVDGVRWVKK